MRRLLLFLLLLIVVDASVPAGAAPQASPYVPAGDAAYRDLDALVVAGFIRGVIQAQRPYSRMAFARMTREAALAMKTVPEERARFREALDRLTGRFQAELERLCDGPKDDCAPQRPSAEVREVVFEGTWTDSPPRPIPTPYADASYIDADLDPLLQENQGRVLVDGGTAAMEALADVTLGANLVGSIHPRLWGASARGGDRGAEATLLEAYVRGVVGNLSVEVGRNHVPRGYGRQAGPVVSHNARGMDLVRVSMERSARLPGVLAWAGPVGVSAWVADMGSSRDTPHSKLIVIEGTVQPHPSFEMGGLVLNHQGGEGAPPANWTQRVADLFGLLDYGGLDIEYGAFSDKVMALDARLTLQDPGIEAFLSYAATDVNVPNPSTYTTEAMWIGGLRVLGLGDAGRVDAWAEGRYTGVRPHTHHQFTSGLTVDRRLLGDAMGPLSRGIRAGLDWTGRRQSFSWAGAAETYRGDRIGDNGMGDEDFRWIVASDEPDETRLRTTLRWTRFPADSGIRTTMRIGYEHVTRFDFAAANRSNFLAQVRVGWVW